MKVIVGERTVELVADNAADKITELNRIFSELFQNNEIVQEVIVDGQSLSGDYNAYLLQHLSEIKQLELRAIASDQLLAEITDELCSYLPRMLGALDTTTDPLYGEPSQDDWGRFSQLMEGTNGVYQAVTTVKSLWDKTDPSSKIVQDLALILTNIAAHLKTIEEAFGGQDYVQIADVIKYELREVYEQLLATLAPQVKA